MEAKLVKISAVLAAAPSRAADVRGKQARCSQDPYG